MHLIGVADNNFHRAGVGHRSAALLDARVPQLGSDKGFLWRRPMVFVKTEIGSGPERLFLAVVVGLRLPWHPRLMVPISKNARFTVSVDRQVGMKPLALS